MAVDWEDIESISELERGDIVRHKSGGNSYVIDDNYGDYAIGVDTVHISNPCEWIKIQEVYGEGEDNKAIAELAAGLAEIREIYLAMDGFIAETAAEGYQELQLKNMYEVAVEAIAANSIRIKQAQEEE